MTTAPARTRSRIVVLHRFDSGGIERFVTNLLIPQLCEHAICFRIRQAGNVPGEPGYWLHLFQLLSGIADAVVTVEFASESYSQNIFFEQVLAPQLATGKTVRSKLFQAWEFEGLDADELAKIPLLNISILDCPLAEFFVYPDPMRHSVVIDVRNSTGADLIAALKLQSEELFAVTSDRSQRYRKVAPRLAQLEENLFWGFLRHPLLASSISIDAAPDVAELLHRRANVDDLSQHVGDAAAVELINDPAARAWWAQMSDRVIATARPSTAADKIAAVQAKKWQWVLQPNNRSKLRIAAYNFAWRSSSRLQIIRYRWLIRRRNL